MSLLQSGGILEDAPQPPVGRRGLTAQQVNDEITRRLASYITQARITTLLGEKVDESDYNLQVATLNSRDTENRNNLTAAVARIAANESEIDTLETGKLEVEDFYIDPDKRYVTPAQLSDNFVLYFSHVPAKYQSANLVRVNWDGIPVYAGAWTPSTEYILFGIDPRQLDNLRTNVTRDKVDWLIEVRFFNSSEALGTETLRILIDRG